MAKHKPKHQERARTRPHHDIIHALVRAGIETKDCTAPSATVPQILARYRDVIWWVMVHKSEPDLVWSPGMVAHAATTNYCVTVVADADAAVRKVIGRQHISRRQQGALGELLLTGRDFFTQKDVAEALNNYDKNQATS